MIILKVAFVSLLTQVLEVKRTLGKIVKIAS